MTVYKMVKGERYDSVRTDTHHAITVTRFEQRRKTKDTDDNSAR